ncbi:elongation factor G [Roseiterribacter gracilis]|uniref:Elongation factor G n=1 Tax=Roseiterribacter gracilis TaxID=2812848 RepID=A0A8S8XDN2_9PROT|nr:elongation factor G [Rhodospirillales bacterium TMPK1]
MATRTLNQNAGNQNAGGPRTAVLVGPYTAGKTTLFESLLHMSGAIPRKGAVAAGTSVGDNGPEARARQTTIEPNIAHTTYLGDHWTLIDAPGSVELTQDAQACAMIADIVILVTEGDPDRAVSLAPWLRFLDAQHIPHAIFVNKMDKTSHRLRDVLAAFQLVSPKKLVLREVPLREGDQVVGYVDLVSERAWRFRPNQKSDLVELPDAAVPREREARQELLEAIADYDDAILEQLLEDRVPATADIYAQLAKDVAEETLVPVFFGSAENSNGVRRLWKALRHETPDVSRAAKRLSVPDSTDPGSGSGASFSATVFKTLHQPHAGKLSLARLWHGKASEGMSIGGRRLAGLYRMFGGELQKASEAVAGDVIALARLDELLTGQRIGLDGKGIETAGWPLAPQPTYTLAMQPADRKDEVKLTAGLHKLIDEDPSLSISHDGDTGQLLLHGQGDIHLAIAVERMKSRFNVAVVTAPPRVGYKETIRKPVRQHARHKRQTGGHGQFGDVHIEVRPQPRGAGYAFENKVVGGAIPKNYIPAVDLGIRDALSKGPLGFPVVDVAVALVDGTYHAVDSSDQAFRTTGWLAMQEALPKCDPVLLEPILELKIQIPNGFTAKVHGIVSGRRGQIVGLAARDGWPGWDEMSCRMPASETLDLATELRSATLGVGTFTTRFDHLQEVTGKLADRIVEERKRAIAA